MTALKTVGVLAVLIVTMLVGNQAFSLLNAPSNMSVAGGVGILLGIVAFYVWAVPKAWRSFSSSTSRLTPALLLVAVSLIAIGCGRIDPGHVGIKVNNWGSDRGVQGADVKLDKEGNPILPDNVVVVTGGYFVNPVTTSVFEYPVFTQRAIWTKSAQEGSKLNEEICYNSKEGMVFCTDITFAYELSAKLVPAFYVKYRTTLDQFTHGILRDAARDAMNEASPAYSAEELYADKKEEFLGKAKGRVNDKFLKYGVIITNFGYAAPPRPPDAIVTAINGKLKANQDAQRVENELREERAKAAKKVAESEGKAKSLIAEADGQAKANALIQASVTPTVLEWERIKVQRENIEAWKSGGAHVPGVMAGGGSGFMFNMPLPTK
jgi:regulator of protease activity HflC (stomatin/prohibitin superfamily)